MVVLFIGLRHAYTFSQKSVLGEVWSFRLNRCQEALSQKKVLSLSFIAARVPDTRVYTRVSALVTFFILAYLPW